ncbi:MAG: FG-GAP repeat domain-containing protein [Planctomycetota bacterium]|jgi:hypothetical protein
MRQQRCPWVAAGLVLAVAGGAAAGGLGYVDASLGLETPAMEGGRTEVELGDVNGDGHPDLVCIGDHGSPYINTSQHGVMVWFGNGAGQWSVFQSGNFGYGGVALGDVNHDGLMDVGYGMHHDYSGVDLGDQILEVALGDGTGMNWTPWDDGLATNGEDWGMFGTDFADVDNDGDLDVGSNSFGCCAGVHVYLNHGDGTWTQSFGFLGGNSSDDFVFGDVNGDGLADFAASHGDGTVYVGDGQGDFSLADDNLPGPTWRKGVALGDVDGDGRDEVCFVTATGLGVWTRDDMGTWQDLSGALATAGDFDLTGVADMDLDGHGDVVAFRPDLVVVYGGDGAGGWQQIATINGDRRRPQRLSGHRHRLGGELSALRGGNEPPPRLRRGLHADGALGVREIPPRRRGPGRGLGALHRLARRRAAGRRGAVDDDRALDGGPGRAVEHGGRGPG